MKPGTLLVLLGLLITFGSYAQEEISAKSIRAQWNSEELGIIATLKSNRFFNHQPVLLTLELQNRSHGKKITVFPINNINKYEYALTDRKNNEKIRKTRRGEAAGNNDAGKALAHGITETIDLREYFDLSVSSEYELEISGTILIGEREVAFKIKPLLFSIQHGVELKTEITSLDQVYDFWVDVARYDIAVEPVVRSGKHNLQDSAAGKVTDLLKKTDDGRKKANYLYILGEIGSRRSIPVYMEYFDFEKPGWQMDKEIPIILSHPARQALENLGMVAVPVLLKEFIGSPDQDRRRECLRMAAQEFCLVFGYGKNGLELFQLSAEQQIAAMADDMAKEARKNELAEFYRKEQKRLKIN